jgi:hypothetical protein
MSTKSDVEKYSRAEVFSISSLYYVEDINRCLLHRYPMLPPLHINFHGKFVIGFLVC